MHDPVIARLTKQLNSGAFVLHRQRILPLRADRESPFHRIFVRFQEEEDKRLPPGAFVAILESCGLMHVLDQWVVQRVIHNDEPPARSTISLSHASLRLPHVADAIGQALREANVSGDGLCLEIDEEYLLEETQAVTRFTDQILPLGCALSVGGYTGAMTPDWLARRGFAYVKFDPDLILSLTTAPQSFLKVRQLHLLCERNNVLTIADFVESQETIEKLKAIGVHYAQGAAIAAPELIEVRI
jgi:EAL domain-containing protein (putative c-di-GMP-specific phosphodiesterase class I)